MTVKDENIKTELDSLIAEDNRKRQEEEAVKAAEWEKKIEQQILQPVVKTQGKNKSVGYVPRKNIAFKCTYCDGGKSDSFIGFNWLCSDEQRRYNVLTAKHIWCSAEENLCCMCVKNKISKQELEDKYSENNAAVCYEGNLFRAWSYEAGGVVRGINKGKPNTIRSVQTGSLCILTTRKPNTDKMQRYIFGVFIVQRSEEGDEFSAGKVVAHPKYRIALSEEQSQQMCFWNYYKNKSENAPYQWGTGLFRYISDAAAIDILRDLVKVKQNTADEALAQEMLDYFISIHS